MAYNLHDIKVVGLELSNILYCRVEGKLGEHSQMELCAFVENQEDYLYGLPSYQPVELQLDGEDGATILFSGVVTELSVEISSEVSVVKIKGKSYSWLMDLTKKSRSFQNVQMSSQAFLSSVMADYPGSSVFYAAQDMPIGKLIVQYEETDWQFLKRVFSMAGMTVTPYEYQAGIKIYVGIPALSQNKVPYQIQEIHKDMESYYCLKANGRMVHASDFTRYQVLSQQLFRLFDMIEVNGLPFTVRSYVYDFNGQEMTGIYGLQMAQGLLVPTIYPMHLIGAALTGTVVNVSGTAVQVALEIDKESGNPAAFWFPYSTISASPNGSGWYCMPEPGDDVRIYFPSKNEQEAIALSSVSNYPAPKGGGKDRMQDPNVRYLRTKAGQELALTPELMVLSCAGGASTLSILNDGNITVSAQKKVLVNAVGPVTLHAEKNITLQAQGLISLQSLEGGKVALGGSEIQFSGTEVKLD